MAADIETWPQWSQEMRACELLHAANQHLRNSFSYDLPRDLAQAHFDARHILIRLEHEVFMESYRDFEQWRIGVKRKAAAGVSH